jgi:ribosomal protein L34
MHVKTRNSKKKYAKSTGFRTRMKTRGGREIIRRRRRIGRKLPGARAAGD